MAKLQRTERTTYKADLSGAKGEPTTVTVWRHDNVQITDAAGRRHHSRGYHESQRTRVLELTMAQAADLLCSLADSVSFFAVHGEEGGL